MLKKYVIDGLTEKSVAAQKNANKICREWNFVDTFAPGLILKQCEKRKNCKHQVKSMMILLKILMINGGEMNFF